MNEQQGNPLDHRVRQALGNLPNVPAPGTTFNADKLWERLRPELATPLGVVVPRQTSQVRQGWLIAASLAGIGLFFGWLLHTRSSLEEPKTDLRVVGNIVKKAPDRPLQRTWPREKLLAVSPKVKTQLADNQKISQVKESKFVPKKPTDVPDSQPIVAITNPAEAGQAVPDKLPVVETLPTEPVPVQISTLPANRKPLAALPKRRFAVAHQNELAAEEEAVYNQIHSRNRSERFVELGAGSYQSTAPDHQPIAIPVPINRKSIQ